LKSCNPVKKQLLRIAPTQHPVATSLQFEKQKAKNKRQVLIYSSSDLPNVLLQPRAKLLPFALFFLLFALQQIPPQTSGLLEKQTAKGKKQTASSGLHNLLLQPRLQAFCLLLFALCFLLFKESHLSERQTAKGKKQTASSGLHQGCSVLGQPWG